MWAPGFLRSRPPAHCSSSDVAPEGRWQEPLIFSAGPFSYSAETLLQIVAARCTGFVGFTTLAFCMSIHVFLPYCYNEKPTPLTKSPLL